MNMTSFGNYAKMTLDHPSDGNLIPGQCAKVNGKWLAVDKTDGKIEREIATSEKGVGFWKVLTAKGAQYFADYHMWCSIMTRPAFSALSRVHRVTCCLCLLLAYMTLASYWCQQQRLDVSLQFEKFRLGLLLC